MLSSSSSPVKLALTNTPCTVLFGEKLGGDHTVVQAARVSYNNDATTGETLTERDIRLVRYLARNGHTSPFRQVMMQFTIEMPEFVARQLYKHIVGIGVVEYRDGNPTLGPHVPGVSGALGGYTEKDHAWNEISGRYCVIQSAYQPPVFHEQHASSKQCSAGPITPDKQSQASLLYNECVTGIWRTYYSLLDLGVSKEEARMLLPMCFMTKVQWTASVQALVHFIKLRNHTHAQYEIQVLARQLEEHLRRECPIIAGALLDDPTVAI